MQTLLNAIIEAGKMPTAEQWKEISKQANYIKKNTIAHVWCIDDVKERAKELKVKITTERCREILQEVDRHKDCNYGITWETFDYYIQQ